jgi:hypothetical protein
LHVLGTPPALILSQDQTLMLKTLFHPSLAGLRRLAQGFATFNASADDLALRCFVLRVGEQFATASPFNAMLRRCSLTLDGLFEFTHCCAPSNACCACTHYLVFKEPEYRRRVRVAGPLRSASFAGFRGTF